MAKFSVMFWNVENFGRLLNGDAASLAAHQQRVVKVANLITQNLDPDLICLCEIKDKVALRSLLMDKLDDYDFGLTDGREGIELLAGWKRGTFNQVIFTQRREFKAGSEYLRPGSLTSVKYGSTFYNFLFLHTDSGTTNKDYTNRQDMFEKVWKLKGKLDEITSGGSANFAAMGDLNTMGRKQSGTFSAISGGEEIDNLERDANNNGMGLLEKTHDTTWRKGRSHPTWESNLDHVLASTNLSFSTFSSDKKVKVEGWQQLAGEEKEKFTEVISDHCSIYIEID
jgi:hypothetical protein